MSVITDKKYTVEEYFALLEEGEIKYEFFDGRIYAMAGGSPKHNLISVNTTIALGNSLANRDCFVFNSDQQVVITPKGKYVFPDVTVCCGEPKYEDNQRLLNPTTIFEVLSPSTKAYNKYDKFHLYCQIASFKEYVLIHTDRLLIESFFRNTSGLWKISNAFRLEDAIQLYSIDVNLQLSDVYKKIKGLKSGLSGGIPVK